MTGERTMSAGAGGNDVEEPLDRALCWFVRGRHGVSSRHSPCARHTSPPRSCAIPPHSCGQAGFGHEANHRVIEGIGIARRHQQAVAALIHGLAAARRIRGDDRAAHGHRLEHRARRSFAIGWEHIDGRIRDGRPNVAQRAIELDAVSRPGRRARPGSTNPATDRDSRPAQSGRRDGRPSAASPPTRTPGCLCRSAGARSSGTTADPAMGPARNVRGRCPNH